MAAVSAAVKLGSNARFRRNPARLVGGLVWYASDDQHAGDWTSEITDEWRW
jgi:hypothetical protein